MHRNISARCGAVCLVLLCFAPVHPSAQKHAKCWHDRCTPVFQWTQGTKKLCDQTAGAITQKCGPGFYREWTGPNRGHCVACSCNGLSKECEERTGKCVNCQSNTAGARCERCKEGYYGNPSNRTCRVCPCPFTWNNFALACLDIGSGVVDCLCKRGYSGSTCERCAHGYYGNPLVPGSSCKPCNRGDGINICNHLTADCDSCTLSLWADLEKMDNGLIWLEQQLRNNSLVFGSNSLLNNVETNISKTKIQFASYDTAVRHLEPEVEQLEADVNVDGDDLSELIDKTLRFESDLEKVLQNVNQTKLKADDLLSEAESLFTVIRDLIKQLSVVKPRGSITLSLNDKVRMAEEAQRIVQEMRQRGCSAQREQEEAHKPLNFIHDNMTSPALSRTSDSLMVSVLFLMELTELLSEAEDRVNRTQSLNLRSHTALQRLQVEREQSSLPPVTEMTKDLLINIMDVFLLLEEIKKEFENHAGQLDGAKRELVKKFNNIFQIKAKVETVNKAEEQAEQLNKDAAELQMLHNAINSNERLRVMSDGDFISIIKAIQETEIAANQSREAAYGALKDVQEASLDKAEGLNNNSNNLQTEVDNSQGDLKQLSHTVNACRDRVKRQKEKRRSLRMRITAVTDDLKTNRGQWISSEQIIYCNYSTADHHGVLNSR
ncbi:laminin subunit alpha-3-like [Paralichthys olivaceus]|uniref:laminin subunit alpha-3-like n=1 Tax=Paralichthys olivaceus TaxID=8255 RepID=UPI00375144FD